MRHHPITDDDAGGTGLQGVPSGAAIDRFDDLVPEFFQRPGKHEAQDRIVFGGEDFHAAGLSGRVSVKVAPCPGPSLWTRSEPPMFLAASAPLCRPNPGPVARGVDPAGKKRAR